MNNQKKKKLIEIEILNQMWHFISIAVSFWLLSFLIKNKKNVFMYSNAHAFFFVE